MVNNFLICLLGSGLLLFSPFGGTQAAESLLFLSPSTGTYSIGEKFMVGVKINSSDQSVGAIEAIINYAPDYLEVVDISKNNSIFNLWAIEPIYSNASGVIKFAGGIIRPGYNGRDGTILTITFKAKQKAVANIFFDGVAILASDAQATSLVAKTIVGTYKLISTRAIGEAEEFPAQTADKSQHIDLKGVPAVFNFQPTINSVTHPDQQEWYRDRIVQLRWQVPPDVVGAAMSFNQQPDDDPVEFYSGAISQRQIEVVSDGTWYFHLKIKNKVGWNQTVHFRVQIDTTPPNTFSIELFNTSIDKRQLSSRPVVYANHQDALSGITGHCEVQVDGGGWFASNYEIGMERPGKSHLFRLPVLAPGHHTIYIKAFDRAGNYVVSMKEFNITTEPAIINYKIIIWLILMTSLVLIWLMILIVKEKLRLGKSA